LVKTAFYPGTFDPITMGHIQIAERACGLFDRLVIGVAYHTSKNTLFSIEERTELVKDATKYLPNVEVFGFNSMTVEFAKQINAKVIIRGLRAISDFEYEMQIADINKYLEKDIETLFLMASANFSFLSSSMVRQVAALGGKVTGLVTPLTEERMRKKFGID
jgi:pantetheine-phosphate adenylyltransferase